MAEDAYSHCSRLNPVGAQPRHKIYNTASYRVLGESVELENGTQ